MMPRSTLELMEQQTIARSWIIWLVLCGSCTAAAGHPCMMGLAEKLDRGEVEQLDIYRVTSSLTPVALSPADVEESYYDLHVMKRRVHAWAGRRELVEALKATSCQEASRANHRWALVFLGRENARLGAIYLDDSGENGTVNSKTVRLHGPLGRVMTQELGGVMR